MSVAVVSKVHVRLWRPGDSAALAEICNWAATHTTAHFRCPSESAAQWESRGEVKSDRCPCLVAEHEGRPVGYAAGQSVSGGCGFAGVAEVSVYIHHQHLQSGLGTQLYGQLIPTLAEQGYRRVVASITQPNVASERLHLRFGFRQVGILARVGWKFGRWHDVAYWQRDLADDESGPVTIRSAREAFEISKASVVDQTSTTLERRA